MKIEKPMTENQKLYGNMLYKFLMTNDIVTKEEMLAYLGWDKNKDRQLRDLLSMIGIGLKKAIFIYIAKMLLRQVIMKQKNDALK